MAWTPYRKWNFMFCNDFHLRKDNNELGYKQKDNEEAVTYNGRKVLSCGRLDGKSGDFATTLQKVTCAVIETTRA